LGVMVKSCFWKY